MAPFNQELCNTLQISYPYTPLVRAALDLAYTHATDPFLYNHIVRSSIFSCLLGPSLLPPYDAEIVAVSTILHDLGLSKPSSSVILSTDKRFEVDSANAARAFLSRSAPSWDARKVQLVWDSCALHTTVSVALHKEPEVAAASMGITADFMGPGEGMGRVTKEQWDLVLAAWPRGDMKKGFRETLCGLCRSKPETTYDNFVGEFGEKYLSEEEYSLKGKRVIDLLESVD